jgi:hypothetical protein
MANRVWILKEEEYKELMEKKDEPNAFLEQENTRLRAELDSLKKYKTMMENEVNELKVSNQVLSISKVQSKPQKKRVDNSEIIAEYHDLMSEGVFKKKTDCYRHLGVKYGKALSTVCRIITEK